jgi:restriction endonuclease S subunit
MMQNVSLVPLEELLDSYVGGLWGDEPGQSEVDVKVMRITELKANGASDLSTAATRSLTHKQVASRKLHSGDLVLEKSGGGPRAPVGRVALIGDLDEDFICSNFMLLMRPNHERVDSRYLHHFLTYLHTTDQTIPLQSASTNIRNMSTPDYMQVLVPVPSLEEQTQIVYKLDDHLNRLENSLNDLSYMAERISLMTESFRHHVVTGLYSNDSATWQETKLGAVAKWSSGGTPQSGNAKYYGGDIPWCVIGDLTESEVSITAKSLTQAGLDVSSAKIVQPGTVLLAMYGASIGRAGIAAIPMATNQAIACAVTSEAVDPWYLLLFLQSQKRMFMFSGKGGAQPNISQTIIKDWSITLPPLNEQVRLVELAAAQQESTSLLVEQNAIARKQIDLLRKAVMHSAFAENTGI